MSLMERLMRLLKNMEDDGLIYREADKDDKRIVKIFVTQTGLKLREQVKEVVVNFNKDLMQKISPEELSTFKKVNQVIRDQVRTDLDDFQNR